MRRILVLEDDPNMGIIYEKTLTRLGYLPKIVNSLPDALEAISDHFDLYIINLMIKGSKDGGLELLKHGVNPVLIVSAINLDPGLLENYHFMRKPVRMSELSEKIKLIIHGTNKT